jgi:type II secretory pathway pseudopilin PulG
MRDDRRQEEWGDEQGSMLLGLVVAIFLILLVLSMAAPKVAQELKREREVEAVHRGNQYVRAIQLYYRKVGTYPGSLEALEKTNNIRFLRQRYLDPMTGKADWRLIKMGEAKTTVKGFFGKPLTGLAPGLGSAAGMASSGANGTSSGSAFVSPPGSGSSAFAASSSSAFSSGGASSAGTTGSAGSGTTGSSTDSSGTGSTSGSSGQSGSGFPGGGGPFMGVGLPKQGDSIVVLNEQTTYQTWEFLYDPRIEQLKAQASLMGGASSAGGAGSLGSASSMSSGTGGASTSDAGGTNSVSGSPSAGGTNSVSGSPSGSSFGSPSRSGFGSTPSNGTGTGSSGSGSTGTPPQQ